MQFRQFSRRRSLFQYVPYIRAEHSTAFPDLVVPRYYAVVTSSLEIRRHCTLHVQLYLRLQLVSHTCDNCYLIMLLASPFYGFRPQRIRYEQLPKNSFYLPKYSFYLPKYSSCLQKKFGRKRLHAAVTRFPGFLRRGNFYMSLSMGLSFE